MRFSAATTHEWVRDSDVGRDIVVLMSGGVDSSVTALLLRDAGYNVAGITLQIPLAENCSARRPCCGLEAGYVARDLGIAHYYLDVREAFERLVIEPFRKAYEQGRTPSPCVDCNTLFKFGAVWDAIEQRFGACDLATGHYAKVIKDKDHAFLARGDDRSRDQSYFLYGIPVNRLNQFHLPLAQSSKEEVRRLAKEAGLPVARRQDSMELCFAAEGDYRAALGLPPENGPVLDVSGNVIGEHKGIVNYTIGQRKGVRIAAHKPMYVISIDAPNNSITIGERKNALKSDVVAENVNILIPEIMMSTSELFGKIRSQGEPTSCVLVQSDDSTIAVRFNEPQFAPTPGQRLVLYDSLDRVVAGGVIC